MTEVVLMPEILLPTCTPLILPPEDEDEDEDVDEVDIDIEEEFPVAKRP